MATLQEIRAKLKEQETRSTGERSNNGGDNSVYPFWNLTESSESVVRFLPDGDQDNTFFWVERAMIKLPFAGIKGDPNSKPLIIQVPCVEMYNDGSVCPILSEVRAWFKDKSLEEMGRKYWKKRSYIFQGLVVQDGLKEENVPENPVRRFVITQQIFQLIRAALLDPEMDHLPTDMLHGIDFRIKKGTKGGYADYSTSSWGRRERPLSEVEQAALKQHGLNNLKDFLPKKPGEVELKVMKEMFEASVDGDLYDMERWGQYFKPSGYSQNTAASTSAPRTAPVAAPVVESAPWEDAESAPVQQRVETAPPVQSAPPASTGNRAEDILALIRARKAQ